MDAEERQLGNAAPTYQYNMSHYVCGCRKYSTTDPDCKSKWDMCMKHEALGELFKLFSWIGHRFIEVANYFGNRQHPIKLEDGQNVQE